MLEPGKMEGNPPFNNRGLLFTEKHPNNLLGYGSHQSVLSNLPNITEERTFYNENIIDMSCNIFLH